MNFALALLAALLLAATARAAEKAAPVWLVSNGFHTSVGLRVADAPFTRQLLTDRRANIVLIGWGTTDIYSGHVTSGSIARAIFGSKSLLHVVSIRGAIRDRFRHSDIVRMELPRASIDRLAAQLERSFVHDAAGHIPVYSAGFYAESQFFAGSERFYFPNICNTWVAGKLRRSGVPLCVPCSIFAGELIAQAARLGTRETRRSKPRDGY